VEGGTRAEGLIARLHLAARAEGEEGGEILREEEGIIAVSPDETGRSFWEKQANQAAGRGRGGGP